MDGVLWVPVFFTSRPRYTQKRLHGFYFYWWRTVHWYIYILPFFISIIQFLAAWILGTQEQELNSFTHPSHVPLEKRKEELWDHLFPSLISSLTGIQCLAGQFLAQYNLFSNNLLFLLPTKSSPLLNVKVTESKLREQLTWFHINSLDYLFKETDIVLLSNLQLA